MNNSWNDSYVLFGIIVFLIMSGCATLSTSGGNVSFAQPNTISPSCKIMERKRILGNSNTVRNYAGKKGANYVVLEGRPSEVWFDVALITCPLEKSTNSEIKNKCKERDPDACLEIVYRSSDADLKLMYSKRACSLGSDLGCQVVTALNRYSADQKQERYLARALSSCEGGNSRNCMIVALAYNQSGRYEEAIQLAGLACVHGNSKGCILQSNFLNQKQQREHILMQASMIQQQNVLAAQQFQQQLINSTIQSIQYQQRAVQPQRAKNCSGYISKSGAYSMTCN
ncbi:MAG: hypothetical protein COV45_02660 [Deltaproteobacteria bacterium CG11_big_fil_rev_8_21_14_0_20_47_16]|nr:MAG: hypothetical protein COV45_02660 [Deltaproteobacteria bacterium CG11_big_fil_rev_8_21_14_0_20_47_16]